MENIDDVSLNFKPFMSYLKTSLKDGSCYKNEY